MTTTEARQPATRTTEETAERRWHRLSEAAAGAAAALVVVWLTVLMLRRVGHPYELEWLEGGSLEHVRRVLHGHALYPAPSIDFVSYNYPPLYWWVSAPFAALLGVGFLPLRLVSMLSSFATMALLAGMVRRATARTSAGVVAAGIFAASFAASGAWFDVARVDSLFLTLLVASVFVAARARSGRAALLAGALLGLSMLTKQTAALAAVPLLGWLVIRRPRIGAIVGSSAVALAGGVSLWLNAASHGWYRFAVWDVLIGHDVDRRSITAFWRLDIGRRLWPTVVLGGLAIIFAAARGQREDGGADRGTYVAAAAGMIGAAYVSRLHSGDFRNVLMPAFAAGALLAGLAAGALWQGRRLAAITSLLVIAQILALVRVPGAVLPAAGDKAAGRSLLAAISKVDGDVLVVSHPAYAVFAGKQAHAQAAAISDVVRSRHSGPRRRLLSSIESAIHAQRFAAIVFDGPDDHFGLPPDLERWYRRVAPPNVPGGGPRPVTDIPRRPGEWWVRRR